MGRNDGRLERNGSVSPSSMAPRSRPSRPSMTAAGAAPPAGPLASFQSLPVSVPFHGPAGPPAGPLATEFAPQGSSREFEQVAAREPARWAARGPDCFQSLPVSFHGPEPQASPPTGRRGGGSGARPWRRAPSAAQRARSALACNNTNVIPTTVLISLHAHSRARFPLRPSRCR